MTAGPPWPHLLAVQSARRLRERAVLRAGPVPARRSPARAREPAVRLVRPRARPAPARVPAPRRPARPRPPAGPRAGCCSAAGGAAAGAAPSPSPTTAMIVPTSTVSPSWTRISVSVPATGEGTSVSTLSVDTSNSGSSAATVSPICLNHWVIVPSVTVSPSCGRVTSAIGALLDLRQLPARRQPLKLRPVSVNTVSPNSSVRLGWGWMNSATSSTVASQLTAR